MHVQAISLKIWPPPRPPHFSSDTTINSFWMSVNLSQLCKYVHLYDFFLDATYKGCLRICCYFLSASFHSVCQSLGSSTWLQMACFHPFWWLSSISSYMCPPCSWPIHVSVASMLWLLWAGLQWTLRSLCLSQLDFSPLISLHIWTRSRDCRIRSSLCL